MGFPWQSSSNSQPKLNIKLANQFRNLTTYIQFPTKNWRLNWPTNSKTPQPIPFSAQLPQPKLDIQLANQFQNSTIWLPIGHQIEYGTLQQWTTNFQPIHYHFYNQFSFTNSFGQPISKPNCYQLATKLSMELYSNGQPISNQFTTIFSTNLASPINLVSQLATKLNMELHSN